MEAFARDAIDRSSGSSISREEVHRIAEDLSRELGNVARNKDALHKKKVEFFERAKEEAEGGRPFHHLLAASNLMQLEKMRAAVGSDIEVQVLSGCCEDCKNSVDGMVLRIDEAISRQPIPHEDCSRFDHLEEYVQGWCICGYFIAT